MLIHIPAFQDQIRVAVNCTWPVSPSLLLFIAYYRCGAMAQITWCLHWVPRLPSGAYLEFLSCTLPLDTAHKVMIYLMLGRNIRSATAPLSCLAPRHLGLGIGMFSHGFLV